MCKFQKVREAKGHNPIRRQKQTPEITRNQDFKVNCVPFRPLYDLSVLKGIVMDHLVKKLFRPPIFPDPRPHLPLFPPPLPPLPAPSTPDSAPLPPIPPLYPRFRTLYPRTPAPPPVHPLINLTALLLTSLTCLLLSFLFLF